MELSDPTDVKAARMGSPQTNSCIIQTGFGTLYDYQGCQCLCHLQDVRDAQLFAHF